MSANQVVESGKPTGTCHSGTCMQQATHRLDWDTWANETCDEHTASWRHVTSPDGTPVKVTPLFRCACCVADADPEGKRESERRTSQSPDPLFIDELDGTTYQTTRETFYDDWHSYLEWQSEQHVARHYGDCGASLDVYFTPEEGGY